MIGIYKITSPTGKIYIGQSWDIEKRSEYYTKRPNRNQIKIYNSIKKYGWITHSFETIHELPNDIDQNILDNYEILYWVFYIDCGFTMLNARQPGKGGKLSDEAKKKISESAKGHTRNVGRKHSDDTKNKMSLARIQNNGMKGKKLSDEHKQKISEYSKRPRPNMKGRIPWNKGLKNCITEETRKKLSEKKKGKAPWNKGMTMKVFREENI